MIKIKKTVAEKIEEKHFDLEAIRLIAMHGLIDEELAEILRVDVRTIHRWKKDEAFSSCLSSGKIEADLAVEKSLYKRAIGFEYDEVMSEAIPQGDGEKAKIKMVKKTRKTFAPDTAAAFIWLKNRRGWRDQQDLVHSGGVRIIRDNIKSKLAEKNAAV